MTQNSPYDPPYKSSRPEFPVRMAKSFLPKCTIKFEIILFARAPHTKYDLPYYFLDTGGSDLAVDVP